MAVVVSITMKCECGSHSGSIFNLTDMWRGGENGVSGWWDGTGGRTVLKERVRNGGVGVRDVGFTSRGNGVVGETNLGVGDKRWYCLREQ